MVNFEQLELTKAEQGHEALYEHLLPIDFALKHWSKVTLSDTNCALFKMGQTIKVDESIMGEQRRVYSEKGDFLGMGYMKHESSLAPKRVMQFG